MSAIWKPNHVIPENVKIFADTVNALIMFPDKVSEEIPSKNIQPRRMRLSGFDSERSLSFVLSRDCTFFKLRAFTRIEAIILEAILLTISPIKIVMNKLTQVVSVKLK